MAGAGSRGRPVRHLRAQASAEFVMNSVSPVRLIPRPHPATLSIVIPVFNEQAVLPMLRSRLDALLPGFACAVEIVAVDDGSSDDTLATLLDWAREDARVSVIALSRN